MAFNKAILMGRLTADPEYKQTQSGTPVTSLSLAVDRRFTKEGQPKQTDFITVVAWNHTAEFICKYFKKGQAMLVLGEIQTRSWEDNNGNKRYATEVVASEVTFCEAKERAESASDPQYQAPIQPNFEPIKADDDLPF